MITLTHCKGLKLRVRPDAIIALVPSGVLALTDQNIDSAVKSAVVTAAGAWHVKETVAAVEQLIALAAQPTPAGVPAND